MGEHERNRRTVDAMASAIKQHDHMRGGHMTANEAHKQAREAANTSDNKASAGALRNKRKRPTQQAVRENLRASGKTFIDYGKKG